MDPEVLQLGLFQLTAQTETPAAVEPTAATMACCHLYRTCSDLGHCVLQDAETARTCIYRRSLDAGRIFYGKHAAAYRADVYDGFSRALDALSDDDAAVLAAVLHLFFEVKRGSVHALLLDDPAFSRLAALGFLQISHPAAIIVPLYRAKPLRTALGAFAKPCEKRENLVSILLHDHPECADILCSLVAYIGISLRTRPELEEFYFDRLRCRADFAPIHPYYENPDFLKPSKHT